MSLTKLEKRDALIREGRVTADSQGRYTETWEVEGDSSTYTFSVNRQTGEISPCQCEAAKYGNNCSHKAAVRKLRETS